MKIPPVATVLFVILMLSFTLIPSASADGGSETSETVAPTNILCGYLYEAPSSGVRALEGVKVTLSSGESTFTDSHGLFSIGVEETDGLKISFDMQGYTIIQVPNTLEYDHDSTYSVNLPEPVGTPDGPKYYWLTDDLSKHSGSITDAQKVLMNAATTTFSVNVLKADGSAISGAQVILLSTTDVNKIAYKGFTNSDGVCVFKDATVGTYYLKVKCSGFENFGPITLDNLHEDETVAMKSVSAKKIMGLTIVHILMLVGAGVGMLLTVAAYLLYRKAENHPDRMGLEE